MNRRTPYRSTLALLVLFGTALALGAPRSPLDDREALAGEWLYVEDRTEGRAVEDQQPPMSVTFALRVEADAVVLLRGTGAQRREERIQLDGSTVETRGESTLDRQRGLWEDGALVQETEVLRVADDSRLTWIRKEFRAVPEGLLVHVVVGQPAVLDSVALYRHPADVPLPEPAPARITDLSWLSGDWVGTRGSSSIEERWSPPAGGALLGVSRTVKGERMVGFEYLRVVERDGGLVYVAQPGGAPPTEFVLTELGPGHAVFLNPRHDHPQRITYSLAEDGSLTAAIGFARGGRPREFLFRPERP